MTMLHGTKQTHACIYIIILCTPLCWRYVGSPHDSSKEEERKRYRYQNMKNVNIKIMYMYVRVCGIVQNICRYQYSTKCTLIINSSGSKN